MKAERIVAWAVAIGVMTAAIGCDRDLTPDQTGTSMGNRSDCPVDSVRITVVDSVVKRRPFYRTITTIPAAGPISNVPEFHDCQRFVVGDGYDSLYAIYASYRLEAFGDSAGADTTEYTVSKRAWPAAEIYSFGGSYAPLGIGPDFNCLYFWRVGAQWRAKMVHIGPKEQDCTQPATNPLEMPGKNLEVRAYSVANYVDLDYPAVARWDWDPDSLEQYIGITCGRAWCEVGDSGFRSSPATIPSQPLATIPGGPPTARERERVRLVKGWYDRQRLSPAVGPATQPGPVWGTLIPHPAQGRPDHDAPAYFGSWVHAATADLSADYPSKLGFRQGMNQISLCFGTGNGCLVPAGDQACAGALASTARWWAKVQPPGGTPPIFRCVKYMSHPALGVGIPGTARWRWALHTETTWIRCPTGCCELQ